VYLGVDFGLSRYSEEMKLFCVCVCLRVSVLTSRAMDVILLCS
jgi:hypothetical protein